MSQVNANREVTKSIRDGVKVSFRNTTGEMVTETISVFDWNKPANSDFFLASQFWITGDLYKRRFT